MKYAIACGGTVRGKSAMGAGAEPQKTWAHGDPTRQQPQAINCVGANQDGPMDYRRQAESDQQETCVSTYVFCGSGLAVVAGRGSQNPSFTPDSILLQ